MLTAIANGLAHDRRANLDLARSIPDEACDERPAGLVQSPCWIICHLGLADTLQHAAITTGTRERDDYFTQFGPESDHARAKEHMLARYGSWTNAIDAAAATHAKLVDAIRNADPDCLAAPHPVEQIRQWFPTLNDHLVYIVWHEGNHGGQLRAWLHAARHAGTLT